jgi:hypothetical protein
MRDAEAWLEHLRKDAEECRLISKLATNKAKREIFERLAAVHDKAAEDLEQLIASGNLPGDLGI